MFGIQIRAMVKDLGHVGIVHESRANVGGLRHLDCHGGLETLYHRTQYFTVEWFKYLSTRGVAISERNAKSAKTPRFRCQHGSTAALPTALAPAVANQLDFHHTQFKLHTLSTPVV